MSQIANTAGAPVFGLLRKNPGEARFPRWSGRFTAVKFVIASKILVLACLWIGLFVYLDYEKSYAYSQAEKNGASFARAFEEHTLSTVRGIDQTTMFVKYQYERLGKKLDLEAYGADGIFLGDFLNLTGVIDADGWLILSDRLLPKSNLSDREHFLAHVAADTGKLFISKPVLGRSSGKWAVQFTRRINAPDGSFGGVVVSSLNPEYFNKFYHSVDIGEAGMILLAGSDGVVRARSNEGGSVAGPNTRGGTLAHALVGQDLSGSRLFEEIKQSDHGNFYVTSATDGERRLFSFSKLAEYPLVVVVGLGESTILKEYRQHRIVLLALGGIITLLLAVSAVVLTRNLRYQLRVEDTLRHSEQKAQSANKAKSEFLANMSHELRTPMHAILSFAELGVRRAGEPDKVAGYLTRIQQSGKRLLDLLNGLLDLSKLEAGRMKLDPAMHSIRPVIDQVVGEMSALLKSRGLQVSIHGDSSCGEAIFDLGRIAQVLHNLLGNASKFSPENSVIDISYAVQTPGELAVSVRDSGPGIPPDEVELVFEQFIQSSKTKSGAGGTGLGLAICRHIVQAHGGRIWAANNSVAGASFTFTLPLPACASAECSSHKPSPAQAEMQV